MHTDGPGVSRSTTTGKCAYRKWIAIVSENAMAFEVARLQMLSGPMEFAKGGLAESIHDALGNKSSSTLHSRAGPIYVAIHQVLY